MYIVLYTYTYTMYIVLSTYNIQ